MAVDETSVEFLEKRAEVNHKGLLAYRRGEPIEWNPYPAGILRDEWNDGWMDGADEEPD